jgi:hypothetical protein
LLAAVFGCLATFFFSFLSFLAGRRVFGFAFAVVLLLGVAITGRKGREQQGCTQHALEDAR